MDIVEEVKYEYVYLFFKYIRGKLKTDEYKLNFFYSQIDLDLVIEKDIINGLGVIDPDREKGIIETEVVIGNAIGNAKKNGI